MRREWLRVVPTVAAEWTRLLPEEREMLAPAIRAVDLRRLAHDGKVALLEWATCALDPALVLLPDHLAGVHERSDVLVWAVRRHGVRARR